MKLFQEILLLDELAHIEYKNVLDFYNHLNER